MVTSKPVGDLFRFGDSVYPIREAWQVGSVLYTAGQLAFDEHGNVVGDDVVSQTRRVIANIERVLRKSGLALHDIVKVTVWLREREDFAAFNGTYVEYFGDNPPARSVVRADLMIPDARIEMEVLAAFPAAHPGSGV